jgi:predicted N-acetyltransferase YhbS
VTDSGVYFVDDDVGPSWKAQGVGGFLLRAGRALAFRLSYETAIGGLGLGAYYRLR